MPEMPDVPETGVPEAPAGGAMPPWAMVGVQLLDALVQRLRTDDPAAGQASRAEPPSPAVSPAARLARLERTCRLLAQQNVLLARALGACRCWGLSPDCPRCGGRGQPGALAVDADAFGEVVVPLLQAQPELFLRHLSRAVEVVPEQ